MNTTANTSRRMFLKHSAALSALTAFPFIRASAQAGGATPNEKVNVACCVIGNRGANVVEDLFKTGLCNIVAGRGLVKELIQDQANPEAIAAEITMVLSDETYRATMNTDLASIREKLGGGGAARRTASLALDLINRIQDNA